MINNLNHEVHIQQHYNRSVVEIQRKHDVYKPDVMSDC